MSIDREQYRDVEIYSKFLALDVIKASQIINFYWILPLSSHLKVNTSIHFFAQSINFESKDAIFTSPPHPVHLSGLLYLPSNIYICNMLTFFHIYDYHLSLDHHPVLTVLLLITLFPLFLYKPFS